MSSNGACGEARRRATARSPRTTARTRGRDYAVAYAPVTACGSVASTLLHEATHTMGGVAQDAWGTDRRGHCVDGRDIMCTSGNLCPTPRYDCGNDTYFDPKPRRGEYLYTHWNIAFCVNRFISRTGCITQPREPARDLLRIRRSPCGGTRRCEHRRGAVGAATRSTGGPASDCPFNRRSTPRAPGPRYSDSGSNLGFRYEYRVRAVNVWRDGGPLSNLAVGRG